MRDHRRPGEGRGDLREGLLGAGGLAAVLEPVEDLEQRAPLRLGLLDKVCKDAERLLECVLVSADHLACDLDLLLIAALHLPLEALSILFEFAVEAFTLLPELARKGLITLLGGSQGSIDAAAEHEDIFARHSHADGARYGSDQSWIGYVRVKRRPATGEASSSNPTLRFTGFM